MDLLKTRLQFIDKSLVFFSFLCILTLAFLLNFSETISLIAALMGVEGYTLFPEVQIEQGIDVEGAPNIFSFVSPEILTFVLWGIIGLVAFFIINIVYSLFIHPLITDLKESTYVNARKTALLEKRALWTLLIVIFIVLLVLSVSLVVFVVLPYYTILLNDRSVASLLTVLAVTLLSSFCIALLKSTLEAIVKTY